MYQVEDEPMETLHIYIEREQPYRPSLLPIVLSLVALFILVAIGITVPNTQPVTRASIRVPAVPLGVRSFTVSVPVIPTGVKSYPATTAQGILTITNGSIIAQVIPAGFTIQGGATDRAVYVPARALMPGKGGDFDAFSINAVIGSSVYVRNLSAFHGGQDAYSVKYMTEQDKQTAITQARSQLVSVVTGLHYPCGEDHFASANKMVVIWRCQFVTFHIPSYMHVSTVRLVGKNLIVVVWYVQPPKHIWVK